MIFFFQPIPNMPNIIVNKSNNKNIAYLFYKNKKIKCFVGKNGIGIKQKEGDYVTPKGVFKVLKIFYRPDKFESIKSGIPVFKIKKKYKWCTDPKNINYNCLIINKVNCIHENLFRNDDLYDLIIVLSYNASNKKYKGSAIFIHCISKKKKFTEGCIAISKKRSYSNNKKPYATD